MINSIIPSLSGTFGIPTRLALNPKMPKEPSSPSRSNARIERQLHGKKNQGQRTTRYIQNGRDCAKIKGSSPLQHRNGLIGLKPAIAHICIYLSVIANFGTIKGHPLQS